METVTANPASGFGTEVVVQGDLVRFVEPQLIVDDADHTTGNGTEISNEMALGDARAHGAIDDPPFAMP